MAQTERTANSITFTNSGSQAAEIASLRTAITAGNSIFANDLNRIGTLINNMNGHYHNYDDAKQLATFGNNGDRANYDKFLAFENDKVDNLQQIIDDMTKLQKDNIRAYAQVKDAVEKFADELAKK